ncbi:MAG: hypothetical protein K6E27_02740 [Eubacterium sp.]|nr:hypothetical protein [Eubacterium sp.]
MDGNNMNPMGPDPNMFAGQQPGQPQQPVQQPQGGQFGQPQQPVQQPQGGQFGKPQGTPQQAPQSSQFGQPQQPQGGQFGKPQGAPQQPQGGQFGGQPQQPQGGQFGKPQGQMQQAPQGGQFGQPQQPVQQPQGGQFGKPQGQMQQAPQGGQFGGQPQQPQGGQFGKPQGAPQQAPQGGQFGGQPQQPQGSNPYGQQASSAPTPGMVYNDKPAGGAGGYGQPGGQFGGPGSGGPKPPQPPKSGGNKTGLIIGIAAGAVVLIGIIVAVILALGGKNIKGAEEASLGFVQAYSDLDFETMRSYVPDEIADDDDYEFNEDDTEEMQELLESFGFELKDPEIVESERIDPKATAKEMNDKFDTSFKFKNAARVVVDATMSITFFGETSEDEVEFEFTCGKIGGKWYIIDCEDNSEEVLEEEEEEEEEDVEDDTESETDTDADETETATIDEDEEGDPSGNAEDGDYEDISSIAEVIDMSTAESHVVAAPEGVPEDYKEMTFSFEGKTLTMPFALADLGPDWVLNEDYFYKDDEELDPGEYSSSNAHENSNYDDWFDLYLSTCNPTDGTLAYADTYVKDFDADIDFCDTDNYPEMILSKGITWGSSLQDIYDAYGDADTIYMGYDNSYVYLYYYIDEYGYDELVLEVSFEDGLQRIEYNNWNWDKDN